MDIKERLAACLPTGKKRKQLLITATLMVCFLCCGFVWDWFIKFTMAVIFPIEDAIDAEFILDFNDYVDPEDLLVFIDQPNIAEQLTTKVNSNLSVNVYADIEITDMTKESIGKKVIKVIFDRIMS